MSTEIFASPHAPLVSSPLNPSPPSQRPLPDPPWFRTKKRRQRSVSIREYIQRAKGEIAWQQARLAEGFMARADDDDEPVEIADGNGNWVLYTPPTAQRAGEQEQPASKRTEQADDGPSQPSSEDNNLRSAKKPEPKERAECGGGVLSLNFRSRRSETQSTPGYDGRVDIGAVMAKFLQGMRTTDNGNATATGSRDDTEENDIMLEDFVAPGSPPLPTSMTPLAGNSRTGVEERGSVGDSKHIPEPDGPGRRPRLTRNGPSIHTPDLWARLRTIGPPPGFSSLAQTTNSMTTPRRPPLEEDGLPIHNRELCKSRRSVSSPPTLACPVQRSDEIAALPHSSADIHESDGDRGPGIGDHEPLPEEARGTAIAEALLFLFRFRGFSF